MSELSRRSIVILLLLLSAGVNIALSYKVRNQQFIISSLKAENRLRIGTAVSNIEGKSPQGEPTNIDFAATNKPTILYVFTPTCGWCKRNLSNMKALRDNTKDKYDFWGISLNSDGVADYIKQHSIDYRVVTDISPSVKAEYKMGGTPTTIVISRERKVLKVWTGAYDNALLAEINNYFNLRLPGLEKDEHAQP